MKEAANSAIALSTSMSLLELVKSNNEEAWDSMTRLYGPLVYHWCRKSGLSAEDSADLLQDVFRSLVIHIGAFEKTEEKGTFRGWLWTITRNRIRDHARYRVDKAWARGGDDAHAQLLSLPDSEPDQHADSDVSTEGSLTYRALNIIRSEVKPTTWMAFWRSTIDDIDPAVVAEELGITIESVWQAKSRVLRRARQLLE